MREEEEETEEEIISFSHLQERNPTLQLMPGDRRSIREGEEMGEPEERRGSP